MTTGSLLLVLAGFMSVISIIYYAKSMLPNGKEVRKGYNGTPVYTTARFFHTVSVGLITMASILLWIFIFLNKFEFSYVAQYSSRNLPLLFKISAFWAGQEGSFLFWLLVLSWLSLLFRRHKSIPESQTMIIVNSVIVFFIVILMKSNPFSVLQIAPPDGSGLNPLLQNFWMAIHPPILFIGYAASLFPFVIYAANYLSREKLQVTSLAGRWTIFSSLTLGAGIIIGAFWAYEVLGWGGYWGWDPVENSSLVPWLILLALLHGIILEKKYKILKKVNYWLSAFAFLLVLYATFLTRSGVLSDFSVHSFPDDGLSGILLLFLASFVILSIYIYTNRKHKDSPLNGINPHISRKNILLLSLLVFIISALFILLGTSFPIITGFLSKPTSVEISYYNKITAPFAILAVILLIMVIYLDLKGSLKRTRYITLGLTAILSLALFYVAFQSGIRHLTSLILLIFSLMAFLVFIISPFMNWELSLRKLPALITHLGFILFLIGMTLNGNLKTSKNIVLEKGKETTISNSSFLYKGLEYRGDGKDKVYVIKKTPESEKILTPRFYFSKFNNSYMREPFIERNFWYDIYYTPVQISKNENNSIKKIVLRDNHPETVDSLTITFVKFQLQNHDDPNGITVGTELQIRTNEIEKTVTPLLQLRNNQRNSIPANIDINNDNNNDYQLILENINVNNRQINLSLKNLNNPPEAPTEFLAIEEKFEPMINLVWLGFVLIIIGNILPLTNRWRDENE
ncbi:MAG: cytochrome c biogenesis protein CcsA [Calditrichia bacterium]